jgi:peptidyl-prolyl cis-trans isomerase B (cyclophilin B)
MRGTVKRLVLSAGLFVLLSIYGHVALCESVVWHQTFDESQIDAMKGARAIIHTSFGDIRLKFFPEVAPNHVYNFIQLARIGFYNKTLFHRVIPGFMIQGGDPNSRHPDTQYHGVGGPGYGYSLKQEFNDKPHKRGTLSMARSSDPDSAGSQFFICVDDEPGLDGNYTAFGEVIEGMAVADQIVSVDNDGSEGNGGHPLERIEMEIEIFFEAGDVTGDGKADLKEAIRLLQFLCGMRFE